MGLRLNIVRPLRMGLGSMVKSVTQALGIKPCGGCTKRAGKLDAASERLRFGGGPAAGKPPAK